jgi:polyisoprenoid-binding protein YceI
MTLLMFAALSGCVEDVGKDKVAAEVADVEPTQKTEPEATGETWAVDASQSTLKALGAKISATHPIDFKEWSGSVKVDGDTLTAVSFTVQMASLESDHPKLTTHLKDADFFDVPNHPTSTFESTKIEAGGKDGATHTVTGALTIRGKTKQVTFPATIAVNDGTATAKTEFVIDRQDFGVTYPGRPDDLVQDNVVLTIDFTAKQG